MELTKYSLKARAEEYFKHLQDEITNTLEVLDGSGTKFFQVGKQAVGNIHCCRGEVSQLPAQLDSRSRPKEAMFQKRRRLPAHDASLNDRQPPGGFAWNARDKQQVAGLRT